MRERTPIQRADCGLCRYFLLCTTKMSSDITDLFIHEDSHPVVDNRLSFPWLYTEGELIK